MAIPPLRNLIIGYAITIFVVVLILLYTFSTLIKQEESIREIDEARSVVRVLSPSLAALQEMESGLYSYVNSPEAGDSSFYFQWLVRYQSDSGYFSRLAGEKNKEEAVLYKELLNTLIQAKDTLQQILSLFQLQNTGSRLQVLKNNKLSGIVRRYKNTVSQLEDYNRDIIGTSYVEAVNQTRKTFGFVKTISIILTIILIVSFYINYKENKKKQIAEEQLKIFTDNLEKKVEEKTDEVRKSESRFRNLVEQSLVGVYIIDDGKFAYVNPRFANILGYKQDELIGKSPLFIISESDKAMVAENVRSRIAGEKESVHYEAKGLSKSGDIVHIEVFCSGKLYTGSSAIIGTILDITERKKAEIEIIKANERFNLIAKATNDVVWDWDMVNDVNWGNEAFYKYYGLESGQSSHNALFTSRVHPDDLERILAKLNTAIANKEEQIIDEFRFRLPDGTYRAFYDRAYIIYDDEGKAKRMLGSMVDISDIKEAIAEKERANYLLNERIKELTTLYQCGQVLQDDESPVESILQKIVVIVPRGWQYTAIAHARISIGEIEVSTPGFTVTSPHKQTALFETPDHKTGIIEVIYSEQKPEEHEGPFLKEERDLIDMLANMLKIYLTRRQETEALKKSEANLHTVFDTTDTMYSLFDKDFKLISRNQRMVDFAKKEFNAIVDAEGNLSYELPEDKKAVLYSNLSRGLQGELINYEVSYPQKDGTENWYHIRIIPVMNPEKDVLSLMLAISDITTTKRLEKEILDQEIQEQKRITRAVLKAEENARNKIGQELHDNVNQILAGTKLYLSMAEKSEGNQNAIRNSPMFVNRLK